MSAKEPRGVQVAFSTAQLDDAGITDDIDDNALSDIVDDFFLSFSREFRESVHDWLLDHEPDETEDLQGQYDEEQRERNLEGQPEFNGAFKSW